VGDDREKKVNNVGGKDTWDKVAVFGNVISATVVASAVGLAGHWISLNIGNRDLDVKVMTLAVDILREEPDQTGEDIRRWAVQILEEFSGVPIPGKDTLIRDPLKTPSALLSEFMASAGRDLGAVREIQARIRVCMDRAAVPEDVSISDFVRRPDPKFEQQRQEVLDCVGIGR
jgi:hypothetical protein